MKKQKTFLMWLMKETADARKRHMAIYKKTDANSKINDRLEFICAESCYYTFLEVLTQYRQFKKRDQGARC